jgi:hypothetical protein
MEKVDTIRFCFADECVTLAASPFMIGVLTEVSDGPSYQGRSGAHPEGSMMLRRDVRLQGETPLNARQAVA